jgi:hypothetical protein
MPKLKLSKEAYRDLGFVLINGEYIAPDELSQMEKLVVRGDLDLRRNDYIEKLPDDLTISGEFYLSYNTNLKSLPKSLKVKGSIDIVGCFNLTSLGDTLEVGGDFVMVGVPARHLPPKLSVGGDLHVSHTNIECLPKNAKIKGKAYKMPINIGDPIVELLPED